MTLLSQTLEQAVAGADFSAIQQAVVELILQKDGHALSKELARRRDLSTFVSRLLPVLQSWNQEQLATAGLNRVTTQLEQLCFPAAISSLARFASGWYGIQGCRASPAPTEVIFLTLDGQWIIQTLKYSCFRYSSNRHAEGCLGFNYSFIGVFDLGQIDGIRDIWINGARMAFYVQNLSDSLYVDQVDDLLFLFQEAQVPLSYLPELMCNGPFELVKELRRPLQQQKKWSDCIRQQNYFGIQNFDTVEITIVIPLFRLWRSFMEGHLASFSIDPAFLSGKIEVLYIIDDPDIEADVLNWSRIYLDDCPYPVRIASLAHNYGFGMACNVGVDAANSEYVLLMNSDIMPISSGWLDVIISNLIENPCALIAPMLLYDNGLIQHVGMKLAFSGTRIAPVPHNLHDMKGDSLAHFLHCHGDKHVWPVFALSGALLAFN